MNRNKKPFNIFNTEMPFVWPQPIPEPPRVINSRPMVPDLSITSEMSATGHSGPPLLHNKDYFERFKTICPPMQPMAEPQPQPFGAHFAHYRPDVTHRSNIDTNHTFGQRFAFNPTNFNQNNDNTQRIKGFGSDSTDEGKNKGVFTYRKTTEEKPIEAQNSCKQKIIRHQVNSGQVNKQTSDCPKTNRQTVSRNVKSPTNEEMMQIIRLQDLQLQKISEQIEELLEMHKIDKKGEQNTNNNKRSVQTMTSLVYEDKYSTPLCNRHASKPKTETQKTPSTASKDLRALRLNTISESSETSEVELNSSRLAFDDSPMRRMNDSSSIERMRANRDNSVDDPFYDRMINEIDVMLHNGSSEETDSGHRSSCSPTPPRSRQRTTTTHDRRHRVELQSEQTLYIKRLAAKYSVEDSVEYMSNHKHVTNRRSEQKFVRSDKCERADLNVYGLTKSASIATKNYLEKYGLTFSPPKVHKNLNLCDNHLTHRTKTKLNRNKILDIEALKRQNKLT